MKGVILAAGDGTRLAPLSFGLPKPLITVAGKPMIEYTLEAFFEAGIRELILVVGYKMEMIMSYVGDGARWGIRVDYASNPDYELGNALSVYAAKRLVGDEPFVLSMADHLISPRILRTLLASERGGDTLCVDRLAWAPPQINDATRVWVNKDGFVVRIGKRIEIWNAVDVGVFLLTPAIFVAISHLPKAGDEGCGLTDGVRWLIEKGKGVRACDVSGSFWMDVDTPEDLRYVEEILSIKEF
jgi:choline kinase